jgi:hypothetical protein
MPKTILYMTKVTLTAVIPVSVHIGKSLNKTYEAQSVKNKEAMIKLR